jgi:hypothetical protein
MVGIFRVQSGSARSVAETKVRCGWGVLRKATRRRRRVGRARMRIRVFVDIWPSSRFGLDLGSVRLVRRVSGTRRLSCQARQDVGQVQYRTDL